MAFDKTTLTYFWQNIIARLDQFVKKEDGKSLSSNDYTAADKAKVDAAASITYVNERGLPQDAGEYKQLVTDGEGKWVPVDRLGWKEGESVSVIAEQSVTTTKAPYGNSVSGSGTIDGTLEYEKLYRVVFEGVTYDCICHQSNNAQYIIGNARWGSSNQDATDDISDNSPFCIRQNGTTFYLYTETAGTYTVSVEQVNETTHPIPAEYLPQPIVFMTSDLSAITCNKTADEVVEAIAANAQTDVWLSVPSEGVSLHAISNAAGSSAAKFTFLLVNSKAFTVTSIDVTVQNGEFTAATTTLVQPS